MGHVHAHKDYIVRTIYVCFVHKIAKYAAVVQYVFNVLKDILILMVHVILSNTIH